MRVSKRFSTFFNGLRHLRLDYSCEVHPRQSGALRIMLSLSFSLCLIVAVGLPRVLRFAAFSVNLPENGKPEIY